MREKILAGRYVLVEQIGVGGMAIVYRAIDRNTGHSVAVKVLKPEFNRDAEFVGRFQREAEAASKMIHHNIVNLLDVGMDGENRYLIMEYVKGQTLKEVIQQHGRIRPGTAAQITIRILSALQHAHQNGIIHRDIKPQNILVHSDGHIKVADFGIARMANSSTLTRGDSVMGSVHYFSPEQAQGQGTDVTSDLYSVGVTLYEMLTGRVPFDGDSPVAIAMQHLHAQPEPIQRYAPDVPEAICHVCLKAMEKNPQYRYHSAREMASELRMALEGRVHEMQPRIAQTVKPQVSSPAATPSGSTKLRQSTGRSRVRRKNYNMIIMTVAVALVVIAGLIVGGKAIYDQVFNTVTVGFYEGSTLAEAEQELKRIGLTAVVSYNHHQLVEKDVVFDQTQEPGTPARRGSSVNLSVSLGPQKQVMQVPKISGMTLERARKTLTEMGLDLTVVSRVVHDKYDVDFVVSQTPVDGTECKPGDVIQVTVSGGVAYTPRLQGRTLHDAWELIIAHGLTLNGAIEYVNTDDSSLHGVVAWQDPKPDAQVLRDTQVTLRVYRVQSMLRRAKVVLDLPESESSIRVRVALVYSSGDGSSGQARNELNLYQELIPANASRFPEVTLENNEAGTFKVRVYINDTFWCDKTVVFE